MSMRIVCDVPGCTSSERAAEVIGVSGNRPLPPGWAEVRRAVKPDAAEEAKIRERLHLPPVADDPGYPMPDLMHEQKYTICEKHEIPAGPPLGEDDMTLFGHGFAKVVPGPRRRAFLYGD